MGSKGKSTQVVVVGTCNIDLTGYMKNLPGPDERVRGHKCSSGFGGKGGNQAVAVAKLGGNVSLIARLGNDSFSHGYLEVLKEANVDTTFVTKTRNTANGTAMIMVDEEGRNVIVIIKGANDLLTVADLNKAQAVIENAAVVVCQLEINPEISFKALEMCSGIKILHAFPGVPLTDKRLYTVPTILCVNEITATTYTGLAVHSVPDAKEVIKVLLKRGCYSVIILLGELGAVYGSNHSTHPISIPTPRVTAVDTTGSGDMFVGALAYLLANRQKDMAIEQMIRLACCIAADSCTRKGAQKSFPGPEIWKKCDKSKLLIRTLDDDD